MSEFLAEARILVRPDTTKFRALLEAELAAAIRPISVPVVPIVAGGLSSATAGTEAFTVAQAGAAAEAQLVAAALEKQTIATLGVTGANEKAVGSVITLTGAWNKEAAAVTGATAAQAAHTKSLGKVTQGAGSSALSLLGIRGATLAASSAFLAGAAAITVFSKSLQSAASLETELNVFKVTAGATADEMNRVSEAAKTLGRDLTLPGVTAGDAATAMTELAKAGLSVQDALDGARGTLQLATAAQIGVKDATNIVAGALNTFGLAGTQAVRVADLLAGAAKNAQGEISDFGPALAQVGAVAKQFGVSVEDTTTLLTELAQAGLAGGRAGTSLRVAFLRLVNPPAAAAKALKELNVQLRDSFGNLRPQVFTDIAEAMQGYTKAQKDATLATIFGSDAIRAAAIIGEKGSIQFDTLRQAVTESGLAQEQAAARTSGLQGAFQNFQNQAESLGLTLGEAAKGPVTSFVKALANVVAASNETVTGLVTLGKRFSSLNDDVESSIPGLGAFNDHLGDIAKGAYLLNPLTGQFKALSEGVKTLEGVTGGATVKTDEYGNAVDGVTEAVTALNAALLQSAADSKINSQAVAQSTAVLLQSAADSRIGINKILSEPAPQFGVKQIENIIGGFNAQEVKAKISGNNAQLVAVLQEEQAFLEAQLKRQGVKNRPALERLINDALLGVVTDLRSIDAQAKSRNDALKSAAQRLADERKRALEEAAKKIRDAQAAAAKAAKDAAAEAQRQQEQQRQDLLRGLDLNIEFAQITDNQKAEVAARNKKIAELNRELRAEAKENGKSTLLYKELRNEIAEQTAAINDITKEKQKQNTARSFAQASFEFLQTQQGFAANLLGNLIPSSATGGLVGGGSPVQDALNPQAAFADGQTKSGPTAGQAQTTNGLLVAILGQMKQLNGDNSAPEAQRQNRGQRAVMDGIGSVG